MLGDISREDDVRRAIIKINPHYIIVAAATKHVDMCEKNMEMCFHTNIMGPWNVINCLKDCYIPNLKKAIFISTDKAVDTINYYGICKAASEKLFVNTVIPNVQLCAIRYGNVLNSSGSLLTIVDNLPQDGRFVLTHPNMTRAFITLENAAYSIYNLLINEKYVGGCIYIPCITLVAFKIADVVDAYCKKKGKHLECVMGTLRAGEKIHEDLVSKNEDYVDDGVFLKVFPAQSDTNKSCNTLSLLKPHGTLVQLLNEIDGTRIM